ncbi:MAG TPA: 50S ribosomal protein L21 [Candidatus Nanoarchaeia archaeon]|nr:50S ribosomal protein L21 [Candidatus Nanoarchaeia archaeon]
MYAVIRAGGKQYRVAPGDVIRIEKTPAEGGNIEFSDILAVSGNEGQFSDPSGARVVGQVLSEGRHDKILVFHFKRKKQYKKLQGHRQPFTEIRIAEIAVDGQSFKAPELPAKKVKTPKAEAAPAAEAKPKKKAAAKKAAPKAAAKKSTTKKK